MINIPLQKATEESLQGYGRLVTCEGKDGYDVGPYVWYGDVAFGDFADGAFGVVRTKYIPDCPIISFEGHQKTEEFWLPVQGDIIVVLAKPGAFPKEKLLTMADLATFQPSETVEEDALNADDFAAFLVPAGTGLLVEKGVWHVTAIAADRDTDVITLSRRGTGLDDAMFGMIPSFGTQMEIVR